MEIVNTQAAQVTSQVTSAQTETSNALASDFETFLKMLTAQARYQDPLEPIDSSEYAAQLAQFSMVEQQVLSNDLLTELGDQIGSSTIGQMASWIGMEARSIAAASYQGDPITILPTVEAGADEAILIAYNADGTEVERRQITVSSEQIDWDGTLADGSSLPNGNYTFKIESRLLGESIGTTTAETYSRITEARRDGDETIFVLNSGVGVTADSVTALREAT
ncbi:MAG: flagellar hook capping FlgD N-terminal domain-containing protein [Roseobacter sp.]